MNLSDIILSSSNFKDIDIVKKCHKYAEFRKQLIKLQKQYEHKLNMSLYATLEHLQKKSIIQIYDSPTDKDPPKFYLNFYGFKMQFDELEDEKKFQLLFIRILDQKLRNNPKLRYSIIYYHSLSESTNPFSFLNETYKNLPIFYYAMLDKIYVVQPNFIVKNTVGIFDFGRLHKLYARRLIYVDNLYQLSKIPEINKSNVLQSLPEILKQQKALKQQKKILKNQALQNIQNKSNKKDMMNETNPPIVLKSVQKQDYLTILLQDHKLNPEGLPVALLILMETLKIHLEFLNLEGIFRKSGSIEEEEEIIKQLQTMPVVGPLKNIDEHSGYAVAGVVKKFFTKLTIPIVPYQIYNQIMTVQAIESGKEVEFVRSLIGKLPNLNKRVLIYLIIFLKEQVISRKQQNKMNNYNMSVCFCPCIFRAKQASLQDLMNSGKYAKILDIIFSKFEQIFLKQQIKLIQSLGKQNRGSKGSKGSRGSRNSKENQKQNNQDSPTRKII